MASDSIDTDAPGHAAQTVDPPASPGDTIEVIVTISMAPTLNGSVTDKCWVPDDVAVMTTLAMTSSGPPARPSRRVRFRLHQSN